MLKPKSLENMDNEQVQEQYSKVKEWKDQWAELEIKVNDIVKDHQHFDLPEPKIKYAAEIKS